MSDDTKPPVQFQLVNSELGPVPPFKNHEEVNQWVSQEEESWAPFLENAEKEHDLGRQVASLIRGPLKRLSSHAKEWASIKSPEDESFRKRFEAVLREFELRKTICSSSPAGKQILLAYEHDLDRAVGIFFAYTSGHNFTFDQRNATTLVKGLIALSPSSFEETESKFKQAFEDQVKNWTAATENQLSNLDEQARHYDERKVELENRERGVSKLHVKRLREHEEEFDNHRKRMEKIEQTFSEKMRLRAAENYWSELRKIFGKRANQNLKYFALLIVVGAIVFGLHFSLVTDWILLKTESGSGLVWSLPTLIFGLPALIWIWSIRIASSRYRDNIDQADDALARVAMLKSFIALEYKGKASEEERLLILEALFRPRATGGEGDSVPSPIAASLIRILERRAGSN